MQKLIDKLKGIFTKQSVKQVQPLTKSEVHNLVSRLTAEDLAWIIEQKLNGYPGERRLSTVFAKHFAEAHRTLQGCYVRFLLASIISYGKVYHKLNNHTDARNEYAVKAADQIAKLQEVGDITGIPYI